MCGFEGHEGVLKVNLHTLSHTRGTSVMAESALNTSNGTEQYVYTDIMEVLYIAYH
jgi:hypothetical protein